MSALERVRRVVLRGRAWLRAQSRLLPFSFGRSSQEKGSGWYKEWPVILVAIVVGASSGVLVRYTSPSADSQDEVRVDLAPVSVNPEVAEEDDGSSADEEPELPTQGTLPPFGGEIPDWVFRQDGQSPSPGRRYAELGQAPTGEVRPGGQSTPGGVSEPERSAAPAAPERTLPGADTEPMRPVSALVARRISGSSLSFHDVGLLTADASVGERWAVPGICDVSLSIDESPNRDRVVGMGREHAATGGWVMSLVLPYQDCAAGRPRFLPYAQPTPDEARGLSYATQTSMLVSRLGAPGFSADELVEFMRLRDSGQERVLAWGVFRKPLRTTRVAPPPAQSQIAFVAESSNGADWEIVWARFSDTSAEVLGLAGVIREASDVKAIFGVRSSSGDDRVLEVRPDGGGGWELHTSHSF